MTDVTAADDGPTEFVPDEDDAGEWLRQNREYVERIADSDAADAWVAQRFRASIDKDSGEGGPGPAITVG